MAIVKTLLIFIFLSGCGANKSTTTTSVVGTFAISTENMEVLLYAKNATTKESFTETFENKKSFELNNGTWELNLVAWDKNLADGPMTGATYCGSAKRVLAGTTENVTIKVTAVECNNPLLSDPNYIQGGSFQTVFFVSCDNIDNMATSPGDCLGGAGGSFQITVKGFQSKCFEDGLTETKLKLPVNGSIPFPISITSYNSTNCTKTSNDETFVFKNGLKNIAGKAFIYDDPVNNKTAVFLKHSNAISGPISNPSPDTYLVEDLPGTIHLPFTDPLGEPASSCTVSSLSFMSLNGACTCTAGYCTIGLVAGLNYFGTGTLQYYISTFSNPSGAGPFPLNVNINPVDDAPWVDINASSGITAGQTLNYGFPANDPEGDTMTCTTLNPVNLVVNSCVCNSSQCEVSVTGGSVGVGTFNYRVTANGLTSSTELFTFSITP